MQATALGLTLFIPEDPIFMALPDSIVFTDGDMLLLEQGVYLHGFSPAGEHVCVEIRQANIPDLEHAGCLFLDHVLVPLRSALENDLLEVMSQASFSDTPPVGADRTDYSPGNIVTIDGVRQIRDVIVRYVRSDQYAEIATHGVQANVPWQPWQTTVRTKIIDDTSHDEDSNREHSTGRRASQLRQKRVPLSGWRKGVIALTAIIVLPWLIMVAFRPHDVALGGMSAPDQALIVVADRRGYGLYLGTLPAPFATWKLYPAQSFPFSAAIDLVLATDDTGGAHLGFISLHQIFLGSAAGRLLWIHPITMILASIVGVMAFATRGSQRRCRNTHTMQH